MSQARPYDPSLGDVIVLMPPLSISLQELKQMMQIVFTSIKLVTETS